VLRGERSKALRYAALRPAVASRPGRCALLAPRLPWPCASHSSWVSLMTLTRLSAAAIELWRFHLPPFRCIPCSQSVGAIPRASDACYLKFRLGWRPLCQLTWTVVKSAEGASRQTSAAGGDLNLSPAERSNSAAIQITTNLKYLKPLLT